MTFTHRLCNRPALLRIGMLAALVIAGCQLADRNISEPALLTDVSTLVLSPSSVSLQTGQSADFAAVGLTSSGDTVADFTIAWSATGGAVEDLGRTGLAYVGRYTAGPACGTFDLVAAAFPAGRADTARATVTCPVAVVAISPTSASVSVGSTVQLTATPKDAQGNALVGRTVVWTTSAGGVATVSQNGSVTGMAAGSATITATSEGKQGTSGVTVSVVPVATVEVTPPSASIQVNQTVQLSATPKDVSGNPLASRPVTWASSNTSVATVSGSGLVTGKTSGTATITATSEGKSGTAAITVASTPVASVTVTPPAVTVDVGSGVQLTAIPKDASGNPLVGRSVIWTSGNTSVATVSAGGFVTGTGSGSTTVTATSEGKAGTAAVTVSSSPPPPPPGGGIQQTLLTAGNNPANGSVCTTALVAPAAGTLVTVAVLGHNSSTAPASPTLTGGGMTAWDEVATTTFDDVAAPHKRLSIFRAASTAPGSGTITITFSGAVSNCEWIVSQWSGVDASGVNGANAIVQAGVAQGDATAGLSVGLGPFAFSSDAAFGAFGVSANAAVTPGSGFTEIAEQSPGESPAATLQAEWALGDPTVDATWGAAHGGALALELKAADTGPVAPVATVEVTPVSTSLYVAGTQQLSATLRDAAGNQVYGRPVTWASSNTTVATVSATGLVTGGAVGSATITATSEGKSGTAGVTVALAPVASVTVAPSSATVEEGQTILLVATPKDVNGNALSGRVITWASTNTAVATVGGSGLVAGVAAGSGTITATSEGHVGSAAITVIVPPPPGSAAVLVGAGDIANCSTTTDEATATLLDGIAGTVFTAGDNAYTSGTTSEFADCYEPTWGRHKARTRPAPGNHDYNTSGAAPYYAYFGANAGPAGRGYYSYDLGAWHIVSLNSEVSSSPGSAQEQWLRADLAANPAQCTLAYWHKPLFSSGQHGNLSGTRTLWAVLYEFGAEVVVVGHDHNYERFAPQTADGVADPARGLREFVVGTGGTSLRSMGSTVANSEVQNSNTHGVIKFTLRSGSYDWEFIPIAGKTFTDSGTGSCH